VRPRISQTGRSLKYEFDLYVLTFERIGSFHDESLNNVRNGTRRKLAFSTIVLAFFPSTTLFAVAGHSFWLAGVLLFAAMSFVVDNLCDTIYIYIDQSFRTEFFLRIVPEIDIYLNAYFL
jgi:hypothetical protein